jgi:hypothetical protein
VEDLALGTAAELIDLHDANRAFTDCEDRGVLARWVTTPICGGGSRDRIDGPTTMPCAALDGQCGRGIWNEAMTCCDVDLAPRGTACTGGGGVCDGSGSCVDAAPGEPRVHGVEAWAELLPDDAAASLQEMISPSGDDAVVRLADGPIAAVPASSRPDADGAGSRLVLVRPPGNLRMVGVDGMGGAVVRSIYYTLSSHPVVPLGDDQAEIPYLDEVPPIQTVGEVFVVRGPLDRLPAVMSDGSSAGAIALSCPGQADGLSCEIDPEGRAIISGVDISLVWEATGGPTFDLGRLFGAIIVPIDGPSPFGGAGHPVLSRALLRCRWPRDSMPGDEPRRLRRARQRLRRRRRRPCRRPLRRRHQLHDRLLRRHADGRRSAGVRVRRHLRVGHVPDGELCDRRLQRLLDSPRAAG